MLHAWLVFPLVLGGLSLGCGRLLARLAGGSLADALVLPAGFAATVVVAGFTTHLDATAELTAPVVVTLAVLGLGVSATRTWKGLDGYAAACAAATFLAFGAPVIASGEATFAGYVKLDDTSTFLAVTDRTMEHGRSLAGLAPSSYEAALAVNLAHGYPTGALLPLGLGARLVATDPAWLFQPYMAFLASLLAFCLYALTADLIGSRPLRALIAVVASQPALLYGYAAWGGVKELFAAAVLALVVATAMEARSRSARAALLPATAAAALLGGLSVGGAVWLLPLLVVVATAVLATKARRGAIAALCLLPVLSLPALLEADEFLRAANRASLASGEELGNLIEPLSRLQLLGIWPTGDFRLEPEQLRATYVLLAVCVGTGAIGLLAAGLRRAWPLLLYASCGLGGAAAVALLASPWVEAKALAIASPAGVLFALVGAATVLSARRVEGILLLSTIAGGVLWSNVLAYREANLAPRDELVELEEIGERFAGQGPALMTEYQPYGVRHFLRRLDAEGASELRRRQVPLRDGRLLEKAEYADLDAFALDGLLVYRTLVLRRSPVASRPPASYRPAWRGQYYEVWQRNDSVSTVLDHLPLGGSHRPDAPAPCRDVLRLGRLARSAGGVLAAVPRPLTPVVEPDVAGPVGLSVPVIGRYALWVGGSFRGSLQLGVDGNTVEAGRHRIVHAGQYTQLEEIELRPGPHRIHVGRGGADWRPGSAGQALPFGPLVVAAAAPTLSPRYVDPTRARSLCGRRLDWVEALLL